MKIDFYMALFLRAFLLISILSGCSFFNKKNEFHELYNKHKLRENYKNEDFKDFLTSLDEVIKKNKEVKLIKIKFSSTEYLKNLFEKVYEANELLFEKNKNIEPEVNIIKDKTPYLFSLPGNKIYLSSGLVINYLKNESLLIGALTYEYIKSTHLIYKKNITLPKGYISIRKILSMLKVGLEDKIKLNKWSYIALKRSGQDPAALLNWIQTQNKSSLDFAMLNGDAQSINKEEYLFKNFVARQEVDKKVYNDISNSSPEFYRFVNDIRGK